MYQKMWKKIKGLDQEKLAVALAIAAATTLCLWTLRPDSKVTGKSPEDAEVGLVIPEGFTVLPLQVSNGEALKNMIEETAIVDLYKKGERRAFLKNLKVFRLHGSELQTFGALVPDEMAGLLTVLFETPLLVAVIKPTTSQTTQLHMIKSVAHSLLQIVDMEDEL